MHVENEAKLVELLIGVFSGDVLVLVIGIELEMFPHGKQTTGVQRSGAPLLVLALVEHFSTNVRPGVVRTDTQSPF